MIKFTKTFISCGCLILLTAFGIFGQVATGGNFSLEQSSLASGGDVSEDMGATYKVSGTIGQSIAGTDSAGGTFSSSSGFWNTILSPTAAGGVISGKVRDEQGNGLKNVTIILSGGILSDSRSIKTNAFGNFSFEDVAVGETYIVSVSSKKYDFQQNTMVISLTENVTDILFQSLTQIR